MCPPYVPAELPPSPRAYASSHLAEFPPRLLPELSCLPLSLLLGPRRCMLDPQTSSTGRQGWTLLSQPSGRHGHPSVHPLWAGTRGATGNVGPRAPCFTHPHRAWPWGSCRRLPKAMLSSTVSSRSLRCPLGHFCPLRRAGSHLLLLTVPVWKLTADSPSH